MTQPPEKTRPTEQSPADAQSGESGTSSGKDKVARAYEAYSMAAVGLEMGVAVFIGWGIGYLLDQKFDTEPYLMLVFLLVGVAAGFKALIRVTRQAKRASAESD